MVKVVKPAPPNPPKPAPPTNPFGEPENSGESTNPFGDEHEDENENYNPELNPFGPDSGTGNSGTGNASGKRGSIDMSDRCANLFQSVRTDREIQIDFLIKDIQKARTKGDAEKADMIQNVLDQILQESN